MKEKKKKKKGRVRLFHSASNWTTRLFVILDLAPKRARLKIRPLNVRAYLN